MKKRVGDYVLWIKNNHIKLKEDSAENIEIIKRFVLALP
jgi:hypothetical protein